MSARSRRARYYRQIRQEVNTFIDSAARGSWNEYANAINAKPFFQRARIAIRVLVGSL